MRRLTVQLITTSLNLAIAMAFKNSTDRRGYVSRGRVKPCWPVLWKVNAIQHFEFLPNDSNVITIVITHRRRDMVELKVRKFGNSLGVVLPKDVINRLRTKDGEPLFLIEAPDGSYQLTPYDSAFEKKMAKAEDILDRYRNTLHVLAK